VSDLTDLYADLKRAGSEVMVREVEAVVKRGAMNIKRDWRDNAKATSGSHARAYPFSISFDGPDRVGANEIVAVIGPDKDKPQGALGNLLEYGDGGAKNPPHNDGKRAADKEQDRFANAILKTAAGYLW
jgi:hypothetical protein